MNTTETLKELKTKLDNVKELLDLEGQRLMEIQKYILILDDETRQQHYENIIMFNAGLELYNETVNEYNRRVEFQKFLDSFTV